MDATTQSTALETFVQTLTERMTSLARTLATWVLSEPRTLQQQEEQILRQLHDLGTLLLTGLIDLTAKQPPATVCCPCGALATFSRLRPASVTTLLGPLSYTRATYTCASCHHGHAPLDQQLQLAAGSFSLGLQELLALLGATQDSFADAASVLARLCLVQVCPNSVRAATEELGAVLVQHTHDICTDAHNHGCLAAAQPAVPTRLYISMDGVLVHCRSSGWREIKVGCVYTTRAQRSRRSPHERVLRMEQPSYSASLAEAQPFGWQLEVEAGRRGVALAEELIVIGDGAHWLWNLAEEHFPGATQIVDWYHASQYVWNAATAIHGEGTAARARWAEQQLEALWEGRVQAVLAALQPQAHKGDAVDEAISYYTTHCTRMDYPSYRARGLQIGSGTIESSCKQVVSARLKQAGMLWSEEGANRVVAVRAWLKSGRWEEALALRRRPQRRYQRQRGQEQPSAEARAVQEVDVGVAASESRAAQVPPEVLEKVREEMAHEQANHPWRKAWSIRRQREQQAAQASGGSTVLAA